MKEKVSIFVSSIPCITRALAFPIVKLVSGGRKRSFLSAALLLIYLLPLSSGPAKLKEQMVEFGLEDDATKWGIYIEGNANGEVSNVPTPSLDGLALRCAITGGDAYSNVHCYRNLPASKNNTFMLDLQFYYHPESTFNNVGGSSIVQALEFTMSKWSQGIRYEWAVQWQNVGTGAPQWRYWGQPDPQNPKLDWVNLGIPGEISGKTWHHLILEGEILAGQVHYRRFTLDEQMHPLDITVVPTQEAGVPDKLAVAVQLDGNDWNGTGSLSPYEMFIDQVTLYSMNWSDEFVGSSLKTNNWTCEVGGDGWGNNELQYYTNCPNASVANGELKISAKKEGGHPCWYGPCEYTSARLSTERRSFSTAKLRRV